MSGQNDRCKIFDINSSASPEKEEGDVQLKRLLTENMVWFHVSVTITVDEKTQKKRTYKFM